MLLVNKNSVKVGSAFNFECYYLWHINTLMNTITEIPLKTFSTHKISNPRNH